MAKNEVIKVEGAAASGLSIRRWFQSKEIWNHISGLVLVVAPIALQGIGTLNLPPQALLYWTLGITGVNYVAGIILKNMSTTVIGNATDQQIAKPFDPVLRQKE